MNTIIKTPEPPVILDRNQVASMNDMYKRTYPGPWKIEVLKNYGLKQEDAEFIAMIHARFPDFVNTVLALTTKVEQLEVSGLNLDRLEVEEDKNVDIDKIIASLPPVGGDGLDHDTGTVVQEYDHREKNNFIDLSPLPEKKKRGRPRKLFLPKDAGNEPES